MMLLLPLLWSCGHNNKKENEQEIRVTKRSVLQPVSVEVLKVGEFPFQLFSNGRIHATPLAKLYFESPGQIQSVNYQNGSRVKKGAVIAKLENNIQRLAVEKAEVAVKKAQNNLNSLLLGFGDNKGDTIRFSKKLLTSLKLQSGYSGALLNLNGARIHYRQTFLKAPFNGVISGISQQAYDKVDMSKPFCTLQGDKGFTVGFLVTGEELSKIKLGQRVRIIPVAYDTVVYFGDVNEINPVVNKNGLVEVQAKIGNLFDSKIKQFPLIDGMDCKVIIEKLISNSLVIPKSALVVRVGRKVVFTYHNGRAIWNDVVVGGENSVSYLVLKGLRPGDSIITHGGFTLAHDAKVTIIKKP